MAEALLRDRVRGAGVDVRSAGLLAAGREASAHGVAVLRERGLDLSAHRSAVIDATSVRAADLVVGLAREHVREAVVAAPDAWPKAFTLKELVRRAEEVGPRTPGQPFDEWLAKVHAGRERSDLLGTSTDDDVADPIGGSRRDYERTADELTALIDRLVAVAWPERAGGSTRA